MRPKEFLQSFHLALPAWIDTVRGMAESSRVERFVKEVNEWIERREIVKTKLAAMIGMTPQGLTEILSGRNRPTGDQVLALLEVMSRDLADKVPEIEKKKSGRAR